MTTTTQPEFTVLYPAMIIHRAGCSDIKVTATKRNVQADTMVTAKAADLAAFIADQLDGDLAEMGYTADSFEVAPCARPKATTKRTAKETTVTTTPATPAIRECTTDGCTAPRIRASALKCTTHEVEYRAAAKLRAIARKAAAEKAAKAGARSAKRAAAATK